MANSVALSLTDLVDALALILTVRGTEMHDAGKGPRTAVKADVVVLDGKTSETFSNVLIFNSVPVGQLKPYAGQELVAQVELYETKQGGQAPKLVAPVAEAVAAANKYREANPS